MSKGDLDGMKRMTYTKFFLMGAFLINVLGCSQEQPAVAEATQGKLKVAYYDKQAFDLQYGDYYAVMFPNLEIEVIETKPASSAGGDRLRELERLLDREQPDLLLLDKNSYGRLAGLGKLISLDPMIQKDRFDIESMLPASVQLLRSKGKGQLYGLAPQFSNSVLYYNKELFDRYGIPYPNEKTTWEDFYRVAARFGGKQEEPKVYGYHFPFMSSVYNMVFQAGRMQGLSFWTEDGSRATVNTPSWRRVVQSVKEAVRSGSTPAPADAMKQRWEKEDLDKTDLFGQGRAAMTINTTWQIDQLKRSGSKVSWDIAPLPAAEGGKRYSPDFSLSPIYSIYAGAGNVEAAWQVIRYFHSTEAAKVERKTSQALLTRQGFVGQEEGRSLRIFYDVAYDEAADQALHAPLPFSFYEGFDRLAEEELDAIMQGHATVEQGLQRLEQRVQRLLEESKAAPQSNE
ncbi:extracellular solute-binding protein [Paenibacillus silviterrae]|uniref:extracellular solute-binding protein n=1 Tax=Paenibacillus silviterrae TaxID=3242194 RepID=UPI002543F896|nr:extracellular solute-binding protein [Paenibacillus chinjuensis]